MASSKEVVVGINILLTYYDKPDGYHCSAAHEEIYMYPTNRPLSSEDVQLMLKNSWFQSEGISQDEGEYNPEDGWTTFV